MTGPQPTGVWVLSDRMPDGSYAVTINIGDAAWTLARQRAVEYAVALIGAATEAEHDAALLASLRATAMPMENIALLVKTVRAARAATGALSPLTVDVGVTAAGKPFLVLNTPGVPEPWQWSPADARDHAENVLGVVAAVELDEALRDTLIADFDLPVETARAVVHSLSEHWPAKRPEEQP